MNKWSVAQVIMINMNKWKTYPIYLAILLFTLAVSCSPSDQTQQTVIPKPAEFEVGPITFEPSVILAGDLITADATVRNIGETAGTYTAILLLDNQEVGRKDYQVQPGSSQQVSFQFSTTAVGGHTVLLGNSSAALTVYSWVPYTIKYDHSDWTVEGIYVSGDEGHIVRFTPPTKPFSIRKISMAATVRVLNNQEVDKNHITVRIWDKDANNQLWSEDIPWKSFLGGGWQAVDVPDIRVADDFYVEVVTHSNPAGYTGEGAIYYGGDPINIVIMDVPNPPRATGIPGPLNVVVINFDYPESYIVSPAFEDRRETRSGYSYMGKLIDPGHKMFEGINWLIRVDGAGVASE